VTAPRGAVRINDAEGVGGDMGRVLFIIFKSLSYVCFVSVLFAFVALVVLSNLDVCPHLNEADVACSTPLYTNIAGLGMLILFVAGFGVLPAILAICGFVFLMRDSWRGLTRKSANT